MTNRLKPLEVKTINIASKAVTSDKIADKAIENRQIKEGAVTPDKMTITPVSRPITPPVESAEIKNGAVTPDKLSFQVATRPLNPPVGTDEIKDGAITSAKMADGTIGTAEIVDGAVTTPKIASSAVISAKIAAGAVRGTELADSAVSTAKLSSAAVTPAKLSAIDSPADGETPTYNAAQLKFEWKPAAAITRPIAPPIATAEIGDAQVTPAKLSFAPVSRPLVPPATPAEMEDRFTINQNLLLFSNLSNASVPNTGIDLSPYVPVGTKYAMVVMTHAGANTILFGYKAQFYTKPTVDPMPLYRLDTAAKDFTNYLTVLVPLDANRKFVTSVYRDGVTTACELYLMGYIR
ncbi:MAG: hypothetical protein HY762_06825 [Planctomycetes bacterium]|nr:hypothetical protein [Planctomycetota bacterium]